MQRWQEQEQRWTAELMQPETAPERQWWQEQVWLELRQVLSRTLLSLSYFQRRKRRSSRKRKRTSSRQKQRPRQERLPAALRIVMGSQRWGWLKKIQMQKSFDQSHCLAVC